MKVKKIIIILLMLIFITGCTNINDLSYDDILNTISSDVKGANTYRRGFSFYKPDGLAIQNAGLNYIIFSSNNVNYYMYLDFINYREGTEITPKISNNSLYNKKINNNGFLGYIDIKLWQNNQYLIEIMYNYAKIEVMVDKDLINDVLINSINILKSIRYNDTIIDIILKSDSLDYTEEVFDIFKDVSSNSNTLQFETDNVDENVEEEIKDTDYIN